MGIITRDYRSKIQGWGNSLTEAEGQAEVTVEQIETIKIIEINRNQQIKFDTVKMVSNGQKYNMKYTAIENGSKMSHNAIRLKHMRIKIVICTSACNFRLVHIELICKT